MFEKLVRLHILLHSLPLPYRSVKLFLPFEASLITQPCVNELRFFFLFQGLTKTIPGSPPGQTPIHEVANPIFKGVQK